MKSLSLDIKNAEEREYADDHLSTEERESIVARWNAEHPSRVCDLPVDVDEAFCQIIFDEVGG